MKNLSGNKILGAILIVIGGIWILDNFDFGFIGIPFHDLIFSWHTFFVIAGAIILSKNRNAFWGFLLIIIGLIGWMRHFPFLPFHQYLNLGDLWPLILLGFGLWMILRRNDHSQHEHFQKKQNEYQNANPLNGDSFGNPFTNNASNFSLDIIEENAVFTSAKKNITSQNFKGGKISALFGHVVLDFRQAKLAPGEHVLDVSAVFGGVELYLPQDWKVIVNVSAVFGGFEDKRFVNFNAVQNSDSVLVISGSVVFGGGEITN